MNLIPADFNRSWHIGILRERKAVTSRVPIDIKDADMVQNNTHLTFHAYLSRETNNLWDVDAVQPKRDKGKLLYANVHAAPLLVFALQIMKELNQKQTQPRESEGPDQAGSSWQKPLHVVGVETASYEGSELKALKTKLEKQLKEDWKAGERARITAEIRAELVEKEKEARKKYMDSFRF